MARWSSFGHASRASDRLHRNTELNTPCCGGEILSIDVVSHGLSSISSGLPTLAVGDPFGIALGQAGFGAAVYVMDFQGASAQAPVLYQLDASGTATHFASDSSQWTTDQTPRHIVFGPDAETHGIYVVDSLPANPTRPGHELLGHGLRARLRHPLRRHRRSRARDPTQARARSRAAVQVGADERSRPDPELLQGIDE